MLSELGVDVTPLPYELHPEIPLTGVERGPDRYSHIAAECDDAGLPFRPPTRIPNTRRALETAEYVRMHHPAAFPQLDRSLYEAHFVQGLFLGDQAVLDELVSASGADAAEVREAVSTGAARPALASSMDQAREHDVWGTPSWLVDDRLLIPGVQPRPFYGRVVQRLEEGKPQRG